MKNTLLLIAAGCLALPAFTHAETPERRSEHKITPELAQSHPRKKIIYYVTNSPRTGSLIPMIYRQYEGRIDSASNAAVYGGNAIQTTGTVDVASTLARFDSSILRR